MSRFTSINCISILKQYNKKNYIEMRFNVPKINIAQFFEETINNNNNESEAKTHVKLFKPKSKVIYANWVYN